MEEQKLRDRLIIKAWSKVPEGLTWHFPFHTFSEMPRPFTSNMYFSNTMGRWLYQGFYGTMMCYTVNIPCRWCLKVVLNHSNTQVRYFVYACVCVCGFQGPWLYVQDLDVVAAHTHSNDSWSIISLRPNYSTDFTSKVTHPHTHSRCNIHKRTMELNVYWLLT